MNMAVSSSKSEALKDVRIYVVESDPVDRRIMSYLLDRLGFKTYTFMDDFETAAIVSKLVMPDLIISDWQHPRYAYSDILALYKGDETVCEIPLIIISADNQEPSRDYALQHGASAFLTKPIYLKELEQAISRCLWPDRRA